MNGRYSEAKIMLKLVYKKCNDGNVGEYIKYISESSSKFTSNLTIKDAVKDPKYRNATWANIGYIIFHELTGINVIRIYSN